MSEHGEYSMLYKAWQHFKTVTYHKYQVARGCFKIGLYRQGITHDLSKYSLTEFGVGIRYFQGHRSPNNAEREKLGYSSVWLHHKGRNRHHYEYWFDYDSKSRTGELVPVPMPDKYIAEMVMDRIAACKVYKKDAYNDASSLEYYYQGTHVAPMHEYTRKWLEDILKVLAKQGEEEAFRYIRVELLKKKR